MTKRFDPIMDEVYANRRAISAESGNDPDVYIGAMRRDVKRAQALGQNYVDFCMNQH